MAPFMHVCLHAFVHVCITAGTTLDPRPELVPAVDDGTANVVEHRNQPSQGRQVHSLRLGQRPRGACDILAKELKLTKIKKHVH